MSVKMSKSSQTEQSIVNLSDDVILLAKMREESYWKLREELRLKYGVDGENSKA